jgi:DNA invertase Pin-like site-specific DNA recombinase
MTDLAYCRVSSSGQTLDQQEDALVKAGIDPAHIYSDTISGTVRSNRPGLDALLVYARPGDTVTVVRLDRLGRSVPMIFQTIELLLERGIVLRSLTEQIDMSTVTGRLMVGVLASFAAFERDLQRERISEARAAVEARGGRWGRKAVLTPAQVQMAKAARAAGQSPTEIAKELGCSRATLYRVTAEQAA